VAGASRRTVATLDLPENSSQRIATGLMIACTAPVMRE
jgi:hypothetical protein